MEDYFGCQMDTERTTEKRFPKDIQNRSRYARIAAAHERSHRQQQWKETVEKQQTAKLYTRAFIVDSVCSLQHLWFKAHQGERQVVRP